MRGFLTAIGFLTVIPVKGAADDADGLARSMAWFPAVGLLIGAFLVLADASLGILLPGPVADALLVAFLAFITGGLHLDGFADTLDGIYGGQGDRARTLAIMKDSRTGAAGVAGLVMLLIVKFAALGALEGGLRVQALLAAPMLARWSQVQLAFGSERARSGEPSLAAPFLERLGHGGYFAATVSAALAVMLFAGFKALGPLAVVGVMALGARLYFASRLGGVTGDTIGAMSEASEAATLVAFAAMA